MQSIDCSRDSNTNAWETRMTSHNVQALSHTSHPGLVDYTQVTTAIHSQRLMRIYSFDLCLANFFSTPLVLSCRSYTTLQ